MSAADPGATIRTMSARDGAASEPGAVTRNAVHEDRGDEEALVRLMIAYQAGELSAFRNLYDHLYPELRRYFARAERSGMAREDLLQETFMEMHRSRRTYLPPLPVRPWLFGIARNVYRRERRVRVRRLMHEDSVNDPAPEPAWRVRAARPGYADVDEALRHLPVPRRTAWRLRHEYGFTFKEIASKLGIGVNAAKLRASRAMSTLRALLGVARVNDDD